MKSKILTLLFIALTTQIYFAQQKSIGTLKILGVLVEFQEDRDTRTYGNGKLGTIYTQDYGLDILDPLPHNVPYFEDHLEFVKNYFKKVSKEKLNVESEVLTDVITVSKTMSAYSPDDTSTTFAKLALLASETWTLVNDKYPNFNFGDYDMFIIFHAGVSKGLALPGSLGLEKDLPSIYFDQSALRKVFGSDFPGFAMNDGSFIKNTAMLPETDSREVEGFGSTTLVELTINGYLCATVGSYLGIPDLFDTEEGNSIIGRYGLMDPQGFYAYYGAFPPEPSAWTKEYLGWIDPIVIQPKNGTIKLTASAIAGVLDTSVVKIPLNSREYYLIENRARDVKKDGSIITYKLAGQTRTLTIPYDQDGYWYHTADTLNGVVIDIDEPDWAVPGTDENSEDDKFSDCGIVIWHIDSEVIKSSLASNKINANPNRRGVYIEEADGIYDLGENFSNILTGTVDAREAYKEDSWYKSNPTELFENEFNANTKPNTNTNTGAASLISMSNFSDEGIVMSFDIRFGSDLINQITSKTISLDDAIDWYTTVNGNNFYTQSGNAAYRIYLQGETNKLDKFVSQFKPAITLFRNTEVMIGASGNKLFVNYFNGTDKIKVFDLTENVTSPIVINNVVNSNISFFAGTNSGKIISYLINNNSELIVDNEQSVLDQPVQFLAYNGGKLIAASQNKFRVINYDVKTFNEEIKQIAISDSKAIIRTESKIFVIDDSNNEVEINIQGNSSSFAIADIRNNGDNYIISLEGDRVVAYSMSGAVADYFPVKDVLSDELISSPLCVDLDNDSKSEIVLISKDGRISAYSGTDGELMPGFPISSGTSISATPVLFENNNKTSISLVNNDNLFAAWNISDNNGKIYWGSEFADNSNSSYVEYANSSDVVTEYFPESKAYNWPNPVYENETYFRYYVADDSKINIKIFDLAGELVDELSADATGGYDNEITWNVANIQSGVYLARIEATSNSGKNGSKLVKVSIIK